MSLIPSKLGAEPKKIAWLGAMVVLLVAVYLWNRNPDPPTASASSVTIPPAPAPLAPMPSREATATSPVSTHSNPRSSSEEFRPTLKLKDGVDVTRIDPTLKLDLLAQLRKVPFEGGSRSLFDLAPAPLPKQIAAVKPIIPAPLPGGKPGDPAGGPPKPPAPPPPPPIPLKFYGFVNGSTGPKRAFFLDGDQIFMAGENELVHNRYRIIRIGVNSAVVEDTTNKNQQTLPLVAEDTNS